MRLAVILLSIVLPSLPATRASDTPGVEVSNIRRVFHNGEHNAFTDLIRFKGDYYLAFRSCPDGHMVHPTSSIIILRSRNLNDWKQVHRFRVSKRDTRDPHFLVFRDRLFVYTGTWYSGETTLPRKDYDLNKHLGYAAWSEDGTVWHSPVMLEGTFGHYVWKAATFGGRAYLCGRRKHQFDVRPRGEGPDVESAMLVSDDGLSWKTHSLFQTRDGDETAFRFDSSGNVLAIGRRGSQPAQILRSSPPYQEWHRDDLDRYIGGPLLTVWGQRLVVGGRRITPETGSRTVMYWLNGNTLSEFAVLPSGGDNSYPGFLQISSTKAVMSWYSSHEKNPDGKSITAIYMADLTLNKTEP